LDKANRLREMVIAEGVSTLWVLTFSQPEDDPTGPPPDRHSLCDPDSHIYRHEDGRWLWTMREDCEHCCRVSSAMMANFRKRIRRRWPAAQIIWVREIKPLSGAFDFNVLVSNVPKMTRRSRSGRRVREAWSAVGGGFMDLGDGKRRKTHSPGAAGRYIAKYVTKYAGNSMAKGFRRWGRTQGFAPDVRMAPPAQPPQRIVNEHTGEVICDRQGRPLVRPWYRLGWVDLDGETLLPPGRRRWPADDGLAPFLDHAAG
jgi:hypothetical protein